MRMLLNSICFLVVLLCCRHPGAAADIASGNFTNSDSVVLGQLSAPSRRLLFGFDVPTSLSDLTSKASKFVEGASAQVGALSGLSTDLTQITNIFETSQPLLTSGLQIAQVAWDSFLKLATQLQTIFTEFAPLKPIFESKSGLIQLLTNKMNMHTLISTITKVLATSTVLKALSNACHSIMEVFGQLQSVLKSALAMLPSMRRLDREDLERRLTQSTSSWMSILDGVDFADLLKNMAHFIEQSTHHALQLEEVKTVLSPLLAKLDSLLGFSATTVAPGATQRRLNGLQEDQAQYSKAIAKVIPSWQAVEQLGIMMCPKVLDAQGMGTSLSCRVNGFVKQSSSGIGGLLGMVTSLSSTCPATPATATGVQGAGTRCPTSSLSAGITDLLGANSDMLGYLIAGLAACGCLGAGAVAGVSAQSKESEVDNVEDDEVELMSARDDEEGAPETNRSW